MPKTPGGRFKVSHSMQEKIILTRRQDLLLSLLEWVGTIYGTGVRSTLRLLWMQNMDICTGNSVTSGNLLLVHFNSVIFQARQRFTNTLRVGIYSPVSYEYFFTCLSIVVCWYLCHTNINNYSPKLKQIMNTSTGTKCVIIFQVL